MLLVTAVVGFVAFIIWELTEKNPIVDLYIFRHRGFTISVLATSLTFAAFFGSIVLTPLWLQTKLVMPLPHGYGDGRVQMVMFANYLHLLLQN